MSEHDEVATGAINATVVDITSRQNKEFTTSREWVQTLEFVQMEGPPGLDTLAGELPHALPHPPSNMGIRLPR